MRIGRPVERNEVFDSGLYTGQDVRNADAGIFGHRKDPKLREHLCPHLWAQLANAQDDIEQRPAFKAESPRTSSQGSQEQEATAPLIGSPEERVLAVFTDRKAEERFRLKV